MKDLKFHLSELVNLRDNITLREKELHSSILELNKVKKKIINFLNDHKNANKDVVIYLPHETFENIKTHSISIKTNFNWKGITLDILKKSDEEITTLMIYEKAKLIYPVELADRVKSVHGFSAALAYLKKEQKILQSKKDKKFFYKFKKK